MNLKIKTKKKTPSPINKDFFFKRNTLKTAYNTDSLLVNMKINPNKLNKMSNLNQTQKDYLKTVTNVEQAEKIKKAFKKSNRDGISLNCSQKEYLDAVKSYYATKELKKMFIESNLDYNIKHSIN